MRERRRGVAICGLGLFLIGMGGHPVACMPAAAAETMLDTTQAAGQKAAALERKLDQLVRELRKSTARNSAVELRDLQARWKRLARADCEWQSRLGDGGSVSPLVYATCMEKLLDARIQQLKPLLCEGAGMTGSCAAAERY